MQRYENIIDCRVENIPEVEVENKRVTVNDGITRSPIINDGIAGDDVWHIATRTIYTKDEWKELQFNETQSKVATIEETLDAIFGGA